MAPLEELQGKQWLEGSNTCHSGQFQTDGSCHWGFPDGMAGGSENDDYKVTNLRECEGGCSEEWRGRVTVRTRARKRGRHVPPKQFEEVLTFVIWWPRA